MKLAIAVISFQKPKILPDGAISACPTSGAQLMLRLAHVRRAEPRNALLQCALELVIGHHLKLAHKSNLTLSNSPNAECKTSRSVSFFRGATRRPTKDRKARHRSGLRQLASP